jgi:hypothetical protein
MSKRNSTFSHRSVQWQGLLSSRDNKSPQQQQVRGSSYENTRFQNSNNDQGNKDGLYAGGYNRAGEAPPPPPPQQQQLSASSQVYRPPHMQHRMNAPK